MDRNEKRYSPPREIAVGFRGVASRKHPIFVCTADSDHSVPHWCWDAEARQWDRYDCDSGVAPILFGTLYSLAPVSRRPRKITANEARARVTLDFRVDASTTTECDDLTAHCADIRSAGGTVLKADYYDAETRRVDILIRDLAAFRATFVETDAYQALAPE